MINCGIEIEFLSNDYNALFTELFEKTSIQITGNETYNSTDLLIKPERSINGYEINIPPSFTEEQLQVLCNIMQNKTYFVNNCAMHIHIPISDSTVLHDIDNYYTNNEQSIINAANQQGLYVNLNYSNSFRPHLARKNLNVFRAYDRHGTVEHRIYKATFDYNKIMWAVNQTKGIINEALA